MAPTKVDPIAAACLDLHPLASLRWLAPRRTLTAATLFEIGVWAKGMLEKPLADSR